jgi:hypothetical protein
MPAARIWPPFPSGAVAGRKLMASEQQATWPLARTLAWVVMLVMAAALAYTAWIAIANFNRIGV